MLAVLVPVPSHLLSMLVQHNIYWYSAGHMTRHVWLYMRIAAQSRRSMRIVCRFHWFRSQRLDAGLGN